MPALRRKAKSFCLRWLKRMGLVLAALALGYWLLPKPDLLPLDLEYSRVVLDRDGEVLFLTTTSEYQFFKLLNVTIFAISGAMGLVFLKQGFENSVDAENEQGRGSRRLLFVLWMLLYGFVGTQMAWTLRPFMGAPNEPFMLFRQVGALHLLPHFQEYSPQLCMIPNIIYI